MKVRLALLALLLGALAPAVIAQQAPPAGRGGPGPGAAPAAAPAVRSPEVHPDRRVTFRLRAPKATDVAVAGEFIVGAVQQKMTKDAQGVWSVTLGPFEPDNYEYDFFVDGVQMLDPRNPYVKYNRGPAAISSLLDIPAASPRFFDVKPVPHGTVEIRQYESKVTGSTHRIYVYTPPGYDKLSRLPVLYLLHGADGEESVWTAFGKVNVILDNLLAEKKIQPMVVVMPNGYAYGWDSGVAADKQQADFEKLLVSDLIPWVQANYRVSTDRRQRALAGLSRGGGQTVTIGLRHLDLFSRLGVFSAGSNNPQEALKHVAADPAKVKSQLDLLWVKAGNEDFALPGARRFSEFMTANGITHTFKTMPGEHTWIVWRNCLNEFAPLLWTKK
jgi:enterochelin esterase-like enzyme